MKKVSEAVREIISAKPFLESALASGIINYSALAAFLKNDVESLVMKEVNTGTIVMSLRRMEMTTDETLVFRLKKILGDLGDIIVRSNLCDYTFHNSKSLLQKQLELLTRVRHIDDFFITFSQGISETAIVFSEVGSEIIEDVFKGERSISKLSGLASVTVKLPEENNQTSGVYYHIFKTLAWEKVNIVEVISTTNEFTVVVDTFDIEKTFAILMKLKRQ